MPGDYRFEVFPCQVRCGLWRKAGRLGDADVGVKASSSSQAEPRIVC